MRLLIIRPEGAAKKSVFAAKQHGLEPHTMPLFTISPVDWVMPNLAEFDGILFTSANAIKLLGNAAYSKLSELPILSVGKNTSDAIRNGGLNVRLEGDGTKSDILSAAKKAGYRNLLWLAGKHVTASTDDDDIIKKRIVIYESAEVEPPANYSNLIEQCDAIALYSPRSAIYFTQVFDNTGLDKAAYKIAALSKNIADNCGDGWHEKYIPKMPDEDALLQLLAAAPK